MSAIFSPGKEVPAEDEVILNVFLTCELTKSSERKQVHFKSLPTTPLEIKKKIEDNFSIPSCVQTLHYQSMILKDSDQLQHTHFRSGDTFTVNYPIEAECEMAKNIIKWLKVLWQLFKSIEEYSSFPNEENDPSIIPSKIEKLTQEGERDGIVDSVSVELFFPWEDTKKLMNKFYFQQEGGLDVLMQIYSILVSKQWGDLGIDETFHIYLEFMCSSAICNYAQTFPLRRQIVQLGGLEMCTTTLLRRKLQGDVYIFGTLKLQYDTLRKALYALCNLSELPECQVPLAMRTDVIDQILAMALHPAYDCNTAIASVTTIQSLVQSPEAHVYITRNEVVENMLEMCEQKHKIVSEQSSQSWQRKQEDTVVIQALKCYTSIVLAQVGLGSPHLLSDSISPHLLHQVLNLVSDMLEAASPAEIRQYEEKVGMVWCTFLPYLRCLYKPSAIKEAKTTNSVRDIRSNLHISWCNALLHFLENSLGRELHLEVLLKEGLLDYTMCLPAVLPGECQPRARSLVNELGKHRQLQPSSLCTLAKAHIAKTFCGLQPVMEMNSIGEFLHNFHEFFC